jgi:hypothetical protein
MGAVLAVAALVAIAILAAKPAPNETVVVLPAPDGHVGGVVVQRGDNRQILDRPYAGIRSGESQVTQLADSEVQQSFAGTLQSLPPRPATFLL